MKGSIRKRQNTIGWRFSLLRRGYRIDLSGDSVSAKKIGKSYVFLLHSGQLERKLYVVGGRCSSVSNGVELTFLYIPYDNVPNEKRNNHPIAVGVSQFALRTLQTTAVCVSVIARHHCSHRVSFVLIRTLHFPLPKNYPLSSLPSSPITSVFVRDVYSFPVA